MTRRQRRFSLIGAALGVLALAVGLVLSALKQSIVFFNSPTELVEKHIKPGTRIAADPSTPAFERLHVLPLLLPGPRRGFDQIGRAHV